MDADEGAQLVFGRVEAGQIASHPGVPRGPQFVFVVLVGREQAADRRVVLLLDLAMPLTGFGGQRAFRIARDRLAKLVKFGLEFAELFLLFFRQVADRRHRAGFLLR